MHATLSAIGCTVHGANGVAPTATDVQALRQLLYAHRIVVLKGLSLNAAQFSSFAMAFANPVACAPASRHPVHPVVSVAANADGEPETGWHSGHSYLRVPRAITMLMPTDVPAGAVRSTLFVDMSEVYAALGDDLRRLLEGAILVHAGDGRCAKHPAVITHPHTHEHILYANRAYTVAMHLEGGQHGASALAEVLDFAERPQFVKELVWSAGDLVIWDNRFLQHRPGQRAANVAAFRICASDAYPLCASQYATVDAA